ncbi:hypothetical protein R5R35_003239 [Gryllus longicercus]|uniref:CHK kinase-like domain-containing protein n=1 Tax=Gryllus longicercus TaxID=2509291 RepID=A0AAN9Z3E5_9ORTH
MTLDKREMWMQNVLVPQIVKKCDLHGGTILKTELRALETQKDNWASDMYEIDLLVNKKGENKNLSFLLKLTSESEVVLSRWQSDKQFFNEIHFYSIVIPLFSSYTTIQQIKSKLENLFPKCYDTYYNKDENTQSFQDAVLVMENLKCRNFKLGNRTSLDLDHFLIAFRSLGLFHAFSYFLKERDSEAFENVVVKPIRETNYSPQNEEIMNIIFKVSENRVIDALAAEGDPRVSRLREVAARKPFDLMSGIAKPEEPLAVLCHGDFLRNNVLFRYEDGKPVEMKFIDFQTIRYASPAIDLSLLLCMNSTHELREQHFHELLKVYHTSLRKTLAALLGKPEGELDPRYSFEAFLADFRRHAVYGYIITIEFLPWMFSEGEEFKEFMELNMTAKGSPKYNELASRLGGKNATEALVTLTKDLLEYQCL